jgi:hypothetical protein
MILSISRKQLFLAAAVFAGALALVACIWWTHRPQHLGRTNVSPFENDMVEGLVRGLLREDGVRDEPVCFLAFDESGTPPSGDFIRRFADCKQPAVLSTDNSVAPPVNRFFQKNNGRPGLVLKVIQFHEVSAGIFEAVVSVSTLPPGHDRVSYRVTNVAGSWTAKKKS